MVNLGTSPKLFLGEWDDINLIYKRRIVRCSMVNSGSFDSDGQGDRNAKVGCTQPHNASDSTQSSSPVTASAAVATCKSGFSQTADSDLPSVAHAIEPTPTKTEFNSNMPIENVTDTSTLYESVDETDKSLVSSSSSSIEDEKTSLCCSLPLDKVQGVLTSYQPTRKEEDAARAKPIRKLLCLYCDRSFVSANLRQKHVERIHSVKQNRRVSSRRHNQITVTPCVYCDKLNATENTLKDLFLHLVNEHSNKYFGCLPCEDRFFTSSLLADHNAYNHPSNVQSPSDNQNESTVKAALIQPQLKDVKDESSEEHEDVPVKVTRSRVKAKSEEPHTSAKFKEMRSKKLAVKSSRLALKKRESKRIQAITKTADSQKKKRIKQLDKKQTAVNRTEQNNSTKSTEKTKSNVSCINPYPEFDHFYRVKKITDHSIDNLKISSLTFDDVFDKAFFNRIKCNIEENLLHHIDGKLFKNEESENRISNFEKVSNMPQEMQNSNPENYGCELSLNAVTPVASLSLNSQYGEDFESQIEYGSKPSKKKTQIKKDEVHYKYFTRRKYQASILEHKENRDLSKLDMWTQLVIKKRQQKMIDDKKSAKEIMEYTTCDEYRSKIRREELNSILDRRGPFEDLREEASKKAALDKLNWSSDDSISQESFTEVREVLNQILNQVFAITESSSMKIEDETIEVLPFNKKQDQREIPSYLSLRRSSSLPSEGEIDKSDKIALICSSQETENYELPTNQVRGKNELIELSGEWARCRMYICAACGAKLPNMRYLLDHKSMYHQNVWVQHYEFVGNQSELYRHLSIPALGKIGKVEETVQCKLWKRSQARSCTKCSKQCNSLGELHRHILECGGDWTWMLVRKKCKYRPFGAKSRRKRRGLVTRIYHKQKTEPTEKKKYKKTFEGPRQRPSDADTIQRMLANLPAKRSTRKLISFQEGIYRARKNQQIQNLNQKKVKCGKVIYTSSNIKENTEKTINALRVSKKSQSNISSNRRSLRSFNKVLSSRILDTNTKLTVKRKLKVLNDRRKTRKNRTEPEKDDSTRKELDDKSSNDSGSSSKPKIRNLTRDKKENATLKRSPRILTKNIKNISVKKLLTGKINIKSFFPVKKRKNRKVLVDNTDVESANDNNSGEEDISTRGKRRLRGVEGESDKKVETQIKLQTKKTKIDTLGNLVRSLSIHKSKITKTTKSNGKQDVETEPTAKIAENSTTKSVERENNTEELDKNTKKRKLKQNFKKVLNKVKRLKIDNNSSAQNNHSTQISKDGDSKKSTYIPFLDKAKTLELPVAPQEKIIIPSTLETKENLADISKTALTAMTHETKENPPIPETIFQLESNDEQSLQAKGELNFDILPICLSQDSVLGATTIEDNSPSIPKMDPISIETSFKPKVVPLISPNMKGKIRKPSRGLNDCIAMLTSKLQQKTEIVPKLNNSYNVLSPNNDLAKPFVDQTPHKTECILKIPTFKSNLTTGTEETALDLSTKKKVNQDEPHEMYNQQKYPVEEKLKVNMPINSVDRVIEDVVGNNVIKVPALKSQNIWNSVDETIQNVIDTHQNAKLPAVIRNTVDDIIDFVIATKNGDMTNDADNQMFTEHEKCSEVAKTTRKNVRKIGSLRKLKSNEKKIPKDTSNVKDVDEAVQELSRSDDEIPLSEAILKITDHKITIPETNRCNIPKEQEVSLEVSTDDINGKEDLNNGFVNVTKEAVERSDKGKKIRNHSRKIGEARDKSQSRGRKKKNPILETNLDNLFNVDEINTNPGISTKDIESNAEDCKEIRFSNEDEPHVMENKVLGLQAVYNTRLSDSDDDIPLAVLVKADEGSKDNIVHDLNETKLYEQNTSTLGQLHPKDVLSTLEEENSAKIAASPSKLARKIKKLEESNLDEQHADVNTEIDIKSPKNNGTCIETNEAVSDGNINLPVQSDALLDTKIPNEGVDEDVHGAELEKSNVIDNDVLKEQTNNLTEIVDASRDEIILDKTVQIVKDEKPLKKLSKSPKSQKKRLSKNVDKISANNHTIGNLKIYVERETSANSQKLVKKKAKSIKNISNKDIHQVDSENKIDNLTKSNQLDLNKSSEEACSNSITLSNVSVKSNELLNNLFESLNANTKLPDVLDPLPQTVAELQPNENEKKQDIIRNTTFNKPKKVGRKPKSKSLKKSKSATEISNNCDISSSGHDAEAMQRKITRSRSLKNLQNQDESSPVLESDIRSVEISKSFNTDGEIQTNVLKKVKSTSDLGSLKHDTHNERLFDDILESRHNSKKKLGRKSKIDDISLKQNDFYTNSHPANLQNGDNYIANEVNVSDIVNELLLQDPRKKISKKLTDEPDDMVDVVLRPQTGSNPISDQKISTIKETIVNPNECINKMSDKESDSKQYLNNERNDFGKKDNVQETILDEQNIDKTIILSQQTTETTLEEHVTSVHINEPSKIRKKPGRKKKNPEKDDSRELLRNDTETVGTERPKRGRKKKTIESVSTISVSPENSYMVGNNVNSQKDQIEVSNPTTKSNNLENAMTNNDMDSAIDTVDADIVVNDISPEPKQFPNFTKVKNPGDNGSDSEKSQENYKITSINRGTCTPNTLNSTTNPHDLIKSSSLKIVLNKTKIFVEQFPDGIESIDHFSNLPIENTSTPKNKLVDSTKKRAHKTVKSNVIKDKFLDFNTVEFLEKPVYRSDIIVQVANTMDSVQIQPDLNNLITKRPRGRPAKKKDLIDISNVNTLDDISGKLENLMGCNFTNKHEEIQSDLDNFKTRRTRSRSTRNDDLTLLDDISSSLENNLDNNVMDSIEVESDSNDLGVRKTKSKSVRKNVISGASSTDNSVVFDDSTDDNVTKEFATIQSDSSDSKIRRPRSSKRNDLTEESSANTLNDISVVSDNCTDNNETNEFTQIQSDTNDSGIRRPSIRPARRNVVTEGTSANISDDNNEFVGTKSDLKDLDIKTPADLTEENISDDTYVDFNDSTDVIKKLAEIQSDSNDSGIRRSRDRSSRKNDLTEASSADISDDNSLLFQVNTNEDVIEEFVENRSDSNDSRIKRPRGRPARKKDLNETNNANITVHNSIDNKEAKQYVEDPSDLRIRRPRGRPPRNKALSKTITDKNVTKPFVETLLDTNDARIKRRRGRPARKIDLSETSSTNNSDDISVGFQDKVDDNVIVETQSESDESKTEITRDRLSKQNDPTEMSNESIMDDISVECQHSINDNITNESVDSNASRIKRTRSTSTRKNDLTELSDANIMDDISVEFERCIEKTRSGSNVPRNRKTRSSIDIPVAFETSLDDNISEGCLNDSRTRRTRPKTSRKNHLLEASNAKVSDEISGEFQMITDINTSVAIRADSSIPRNRRTRSKSARKNDPTGLNNPSDIVNISVEFEAIDDIFTEDSVDILSFPNDLRTKTARPNTLRKNDLEESIIEFDNFNEDNVTQEYVSIQSDSPVSRNRRTKSISARKNDLTEPSDANILDDISMKFEDGITDIAKESAGIKSDSNDMSVRKTRPRSVKKDIVEVGIAKTSELLEINTDGYPTKNYLGIESDDLSVQKANTERTLDDIALELENILDNNVAKDMEIQSDSNDLRRQTRPHSVKKNPIEVSTTNTSADNLRNRRNRPRSVRKDLLQVGRENISDDLSAELETRDETEVIQPEFRKLPSRRSLKTKKDSIIRDDTSTISEMDTSQMTVKGKNRRAKSLTSERDRDISNATENEVDNTDSEVAYHLTSEIENNPETFEHRKEDNEVKRSRLSRNKPVINYSENDELDKSDTSDDVIIVKLKEQEDLESVEPPIDFKKNISRKPRTTKNKKGSDLNAKLNGKIAVDSNSSTENIRSDGDVNTSDIKETENVEGNVKTNAYCSKNMEITQAQPTIDNSESLAFKKIDEPPIKIIINKHKTRRKSKSFRKIDSKGQNDLFEDFALVIKKPKGTAPIITFSPADTFSKDTYPNYITKTVEVIPPESIPMVDEQIPEEQTDVSVEEMDMELDELPITSGIIENTNVSLTLPVETPQPLEDINDTLDKISSETQSKKSKKKRVARNPKLTKSDEDSTLESPLNSSELSVSIKSQECEQLPNGIQNENEEIYFHCQMSQNIFPSDDILNDSAVSMNAHSGSIEENVVGISSKEANKTSLKKPKRTNRSKKANTDSSMLEIEEPVITKDKQCFNDTLQAQDDSSQCNLNKTTLVTVLPVAAPVLADCVSKTMEKFADEIYAFTEIEDLEIEKPLEIPKRLPRKQTKSLTETDTTKEICGIDKTEPETTIATSCEDHSLKPLKRKQKSVKEFTDISDNSKSKIIESNTFEEPQDTGRRPVRTAKVKALEHIHDDALADLKDTEKTKDSRKIQPIEENLSVIIVTKKTKKPQTSEENDAVSTVTKKPKKHKKSQKAQPIVDPIDISEEKTPSLADLVADLEGLEELENSIERELNAEMNNKSNIDVDQELGQQNLETSYNETTNKDVDNEDNQELRRSRRGSRKLGSYNENELLEPLLDAIGAKRKNRKKEVIDKNQVVNEPGKKLNSDELFDLLKASTNDPNVPKTQSFLNSIDDSSTNLNSMFENILEKSSLLVQSNLNKQQEQKDIAKVYEFSEQSEMEEKEKNFVVNQKNSHKRRNMSPEKIQIFEPSDSSTSYISCVTPFTQDTEDLNTEAYPKSRKGDKGESNFCEICNKSFIRLENLIKHKRTLTHIQKLSEIEAKQAREKSSIEQKQVESKNPDLSNELSTELEENLASSKIDININDILLDSEKPTENHSPIVHSSFSNSHSLKLADIINDVLNKPHLENDNNDEHTKFSDIIIENNTDIQPEFKRYKSLGERKSFDSDKVVPVENQAVLMEEPYVSKTTILEKQISLLENIIENQTGISYMDDISMSSNISERRSNSELSLKQDDSSNLTPKNGKKPSNNDDSFLKPTQYEEISEDSANIKSCEDQKLRKTLNRDEELFLECCSLLKSGSEVSSYSNKRSQNKIKINSACSEQPEEPDWQERRLLQKPEFAAIQEYSDENSRIPTPLGDSYADDESNSNTISSNWGIEEQETETRNDLQKSVSTSFNLDKVLSYEKKSKPEDIPIDSKTTSLGDFNKVKPERNASATNDAKKIATKGARKVFEGLRVSIPTEDLNMEEVLNSSPKSKKNELENMPINTTPNSKIADSVSPQQTKPSRTARKSKPVKKAQVGSNLLFKVNKKKVPSPSTTPAKTQLQEVEQKRNSYDVYDFEETQDNSDIFTKPDFRAFRNMKSGEVVEPDSDTESRDYLDPLSVERDSITSTSVSSHSSFKKPKAQENITKKKCMIMGRIFKNAAKSKIEDIDEEIRSIPTIGNEELVKTYVASCKRVIKNEAKPKLSEKEINQLFDQLLGDKNVEKDDTPVSTVTKSITKSKPECKKLTENKKKTKVKNRKRVRTNSDSTDDEFQLNNISKRAYRKNAKSEDNCINLEQELKECIGVASRKSQRKCTSGKQNVLVEYWSSDESQFEALLETQRIETVPTNKIPIDLVKVDEIPPKEVPVVDNQEIKKVVETVVRTSKPKITERKSQYKKKSTVERKEKANTPVENIKVSNTVSSNRRKRAAANPLYHWSSSSEDESQDLIEVKPLRDEIEDDEERPIQHGWIVGDSPKKLVTMLAQAKGKKTDIDCVKEQGKKRTNAVS